MASAQDKNDLMICQEKLEWIAPQISLLDLHKSEGKILFAAEYSENAATGGAS